MLGDQRAERLKAGNSFASELALPSNRLDNLADDLRQPAKRVSPVKADVVGQRRQEIRSFADQSLQVKLGRLPVQQDDRPNIPGCR